MDRMEKEERLAEIVQEVGRCRKCGLYRGATRGVSGEGDVDAEVFFIGEGPGFHEDQQGRPFVGAAGKLLERSLGEVGWRREQVFIGNVIKHRPPENRDPLPEEIAACKGYLDRQLEIVEPRLIVTLGRFSMAKFIGGVFISKVHGKERRIEYREKWYWVMPMYHPAAALRDGRVMREFREDFLQIPVVLEKIKQEEIKEQEEEREEKEKGKQLSLV